MLNLANIVLFHLSEAFALAYIHSSVPVVHALQQRHLCNYAVPQAI